MGEFVFKTEDYQQDATLALRDVFAGQPKEIIQETYDRSGGLNFTAYVNNKLKVSEQELLENIKTVQKKQTLLGVSQKLASYPLNLTTEMETGTGKTYVYTKSMLELHKQYGWSKFIVIVPSIAIREGVLQSLRDTADHFASEYGTQLQVAEYNTKSGNFRGQVRSFIESPRPSVMVMNFQAYARSTSKSKSSLLIHKKDESGAAPIQLLKHVRPIIIIDEPQRLGKTGEKMLEDFNPLFISRYSATHKKDKEFDKIYMLDAVGAYNEKLVKTIEVSSVEIDGTAGSAPYVYVEDIIYKNGRSPQAKIEFDIRRRDGVKRDSKLFDEKDSILDASAGSFSGAKPLSYYSGYTISGINQKNTNKVEFTNGISLKKGEVVGENEGYRMRLQIRQTIKAHLEKERQLFDRNIKVLSLFFLDRVADYRVYTDNGAGNGRLADIFEEEYRQAVNQVELGLYPEYKKYLDTITAEQTHNGYFSKDKKTGNFKDSEYKKNQGGSDDTDAYDEIMRDKKKLLDLKGVSPLRFIFSHSALREGWDNPNIFQICMFHKNSSSETTLRQQIGRGLRICVDRTGARLDRHTLEDDFFNINKLTVVPTESYKDFATQLQKEIRDDLRRPETLNDALKIINFQDINGNEAMNKDILESKLRIFLNENGYMDDSGEITSKLKFDLEEDILEMPETLKGYEQNVKVVIQSVIDGEKLVRIANANNTNWQSIKAKLNENFKDKEFQKMWQVLKQKTQYVVNFDEDELARNVLANINQLRVAKVRARITTVQQQKTMDIDLEMMNKNSAKSTDQKIDTTISLNRYDLLQEITDKIPIKRNTVAKILTAMEPTIFAQFKMNPEDFIRQLVKIISTEISRLSADNVTYITTGESHSDNIFNVEVGSGVVGDNIHEPSRHITDILKTDADTEKDFLENLESDDLVKIYAKLPSGPNGYQISNPLENYSPDWAIVLEHKDKSKHVYFIAETKGTDANSLDLAEKAKLKIKYAKAHFKAISNDEIKCDIVEKNVSLKSILENYY